VALNVVAAARFWDNLKGDVATALYLAALGALLAALGGAALVEERRLRTPAGTGIDRSV
jgi:hypothetical protein